jgi:hypothetical protein
MKNKVRMRRANDVIGQVCHMVTFDYADDLVRDKRACWVLRRNGHNRFDEILLTKSGEESMGRKSLKLHDSSCSPGESVIYDFAAGKAYAVAIMDAYTPRGHGATVASE